MMITIQIAGAIQMSQLLKGEVHKRNRSVLGCPGVARTVGLLLAEGYCRPLLESELFRMVD